MGCSEGLHPSGRLTIPPGRPTRSKFESFDESCETIITSWLRELVHDDSFLWIVFRGRHEFPRRKEVGVKLLNNNKHQYLLHQC